LALYLAGTPELSVYKPPTAIFKAGDQQAAAGMNIGITDGGSLLASHHQIGIFAVGLLIFLGINDAFVGLIALLGRHRGNRAAGTSPRAAASYVAIGTIVKGTWIACTAGAETTGRPGSSTQHETEERCRRDVRSAYCYVATVANSSGTIASITTVAAVATGNHVTDTVLTVAAIAPTSAKRQEQTQEAAGQADCCLGGDIAGVAGRTAVTSSTAVTGVKPIDCAKTTGSAFPAIATIDSSEGKGRQNDLPGTDAQRSAIEAKSTIATGSSITGTKETDVAISARAANTTGSTFSADVIVDGNQSFVSNQLNFASQSTGAAGATNCTAASEEAAYSILARAPDTASAAVVSERAVERDTTGCTGDDQRSASTASTAVPARRSGGEN
jgi:hypothetical protein